jgi:DNA-binding NarL/FixJ family response regulator
MNIDSIRVLIADDHPLFREGIRGLLTRDGRFSVIAEAGRGDDALKLLESAPPQIALLDHSMSGMSGLEVIRAVRARGLPTRCGLLTSFGRAALVAEAIRTGADGYLLKEDSARVLVDTAARMAAGECALSPGLDPVAVKEALNTLAITGREQDVLRLMVTGAPAPEIAERLGISPRTVETYRNQLVAKFGARNAIDLVRRAVESGFTV